MIDLKKLYEEHLECFENENKFKAYIVDLFPNEKKAKINVLTAMLAEGVLTPAQTEDKLDNKAFCQKICDDYGYSDKLVEECFISFSAIFHEVHIQAQPVSEQKNKVEKSLKQQEPKLKPSPLSDFEIYNGTLIKYRGQSQKVVIPNSVTIIMECAFENCNSIESIVIPNGVMKIGRSAINRDRDFKKTIKKQSLIRI